VPEQPKAYQIPGGSVHYNPGFRAGWNHLLILISVIPDFLRRQATPSLANNLSPIRREPFASRVRLLQTAAHRFPAFIAVVLKLSDTVRLSRGNQ
jgi:hypothetical protein